MKTAIELLQENLNKQVAINVRKSMLEQTAEEAKEMRLERAKENYEHAKTNAIKLCDERINELVEEALVSCTDPSQLVIKIAAKMFVDELGNKLFKVATKDPPVFDKKRSRYNSQKDFYSAVSCDFCYKTFQQYLKKHGFRAVQGKEENLPCQGPFNRYITCSIINITIQSALLKDES